jgi:tetratricopeptide (TPR) repeat protein
MATLGTTPTPSDLALAGDLLSSLGRADEAERQYVLAEAAWKSDAPEPARLARFLIEHGRHMDEAVRLAEQVSADRRDIFTEDALAWGYFRSGQLAKARESIARALRTGSRDRTIRYHAAAIANATGNQQSARRLIDQALSGAPHFDVIVAPAAAALRATLGSL